MDKRTVEILKRFAEKSFEELGDFFRSKIIIIGSIKYLVRHDSRMEHGQYFVIKTVDIGRGIDYIFEFGNHPDGKKLNFDKPDDE